jgi:hypothetical protein
MKKEQKPEKTPIKTILEIIKTVMEIALVAAKFLL